MKQQPEFQLQAAIAEYLRKCHPKVMFLSDVRASLKLTIPQQVRSKKIQADNFACPDMMIFQPAGGYHGMFMELKAETPFKVDGFLKSGEHLQNQGLAILRLKSLGYHAEFYWDLDNALRQIQLYLGPYRSANNYAPAPHQPVA